MSWTQRGFQEFSVLHCETRVQVDPSNNTKELVLKTMTPHPLIPTPLGQLFAQNFLLDAYRNPPVNPPASTSRIQPTHPPTFLPNAHPTDATPISTLSPRRALLQQV